MKAHHLALTLTLAVAGCATTARQCDFINHSGVCETLATPAEQAEARAILLRLQSRAVCGDVDLSAPRKVYPHVNDPHNPIR